MITIIYKITKHIGLIAGLLLFLSPGMNPLSGQIADRMPNQLKGLTVEEQLGDTIPKDIRFTNHFGEQVTLEQYFHQDKPVLLTLSYYTCPMLCPMILQGIATTADSLSLSPGSDYQMVSVSINPRETVELARAKHEKFVKMMDAPVGNRGWMFHVGKQEQISQLADTLGFPYRYLEEKEQYAHPAVYFVLTEEGVVSRYLYGLNQKKRTLRLALVEASEGEIGNTIDKVLLYCCQYNPESGSYVAIANRVMNLGAIATVFVLGGVLGVWWFREYRDGQV